MMSSTFHRDVHYWDQELGEPPCETLEDRFEWSDAIEDVTCEACREILAGSTAGSRMHLHDGERPGA